MKENISFSRFTDAFRDYNRKDNFSYNGLRALYDYLIDLEEDTGQEIELDVIALCCEYTEYEDLIEYLKDYSNQHEARQEDEDNQEYHDRIKQEIEDKTNLIMVNNDNELESGFIIQSY